MYDVPAPFICNSPATYQLFISAETIRQRPRRSHKKRGKGERPFLHERTTRIFGVRPERNSGLLSRRSGPFIFLRIAREPAIIRIRVKIILKYFDNGRRWTVASDMAWFTSRKGQFVVNTGDLYLKFQIAKRECNNSRYPVTLRRE